MEMLTRTNVDGMLLERIALSVTKIIMGMRRRVGIRGVRIETWEVITLYGNIIREVSVVNNRLGSGIDTHQSFFFG